jgi:hypothetical protein
MGVYSGGHGARGGRLYDWAQVELAALAAPGMARWLLVRRRRHGELAFSACSDPVSTSLVGLVGVAGMRWPVEALSRPRRGQPGPPRGYVAGRAGTGPSPWRGAHTFLVVTRTKAATSGGAKGDAAAGPASLACSC